MSISHPTRERISLSDLVTLPRDINACSKKRRRSAEWPLTPISDDTGTSSSSLPPGSPAYSDIPYSPPSPSPTPSKNGSPPMDFAVTRSSALKRANHFESGRKWVENWLTNEDAWSGAITRPRWSIPIPPETVTSEYILSRLHGTDSSPFIVNSPFVSLGGCTPGLPLNKLAKDFGEDMPCTVYDPTSEYHLTLTLAELCQAVDDPHRPPLNAHTITLDQTVWGKAGKCRPAEIVDMASASFFVRNKDRGIVDSLQQQVLAIAKSGSYTVRSADEAE